MYKSTIKSFFAALCFLPVAAFAGSVTEIGDTTLSALEMQRSGSNAADTRPLLKDVADRTYDRYLESFTHPIPDQYEREEEFLTGN